MKKNLKRVAFFIMLLIIGLCFTFTSSNLKKIDSNEYYNLYKVKDLSSLHEKNMFNYSFHTRNDYKSYLMELSLENGAFFETKKNI